MNPETVTSLILKVLDRIPLSKMTEFFITKKPIIEARISKPNNCDYYQLVVAFKPGKEKVAFISISVSGASISENFDGQPFRKKVETLFKVYSSDHSTSPVFRTFRLKPDNPNFDPLYDDLTVTIRRAGLIPRFVRIRVIEDKYEKLIQALQEFSNLQD